MFAELAARSHYSFLEGSASPQALVEAALACELSALGLCDRNGLYGAVGFVEAARKAGIHPVIGAELDLVDGSRLRLLARDRTGYRQLARTISAAQLAGEKGQPLLDLFGDPLPAPPPAGRAIPTLAPPERPAALRPTAGPFPSGWPGLPSTTPRASGPAARVDPASLSHCTVIAGGPHSAITEALVGGDRRQAGRRLDRLREAFGRDRLLLLLTHHLHPADTWIAAETHALAQRSGIRCMVSSTPVHANYDDKSLLDVLTAIRHRTTLDAAAAHGLLLPNSEHRLRSEQEVGALLGAYPDAMTASAELARECSVSLDFSDVRFPGFPVPHGETPFSMLYRLCQEAVQRRYQPISRVVAARLQRELDVIEKTGLAEFFLICWDLMRHAREHGIPGQGRGSAADSIVAYLLGVTRVDPVEHDLLFERFLHEDHQGTPDIDIDFSTDHREQIIQYVYERYGPERTGMVANVITYRPRLAVRDVGRAMAFPETIIDRLAKSVDGWYWEGFDDALRLAGLDISGPVTSERDAAALDRSTREASSQAHHRDPPPITPAPPTTVAARPALTPKVQPPSRSAGDGPGSGAHPSPDNPQQRQPSTLDSDSQRGRPGTGVPLAPQRPSPTAEPPLPWRQFLDTVGQIMGVPRHLGIHVGGMLVTGEPLVDVAPVERATMPGRVVVQFNKDDVEDLGLIKMDLLGLRTLSAIAECLELIEHSSGTRPDLDAVPLDDARIYDMICTPDTIGLFQIESRAQQQSLYQSQPRCFNDLIVQVAIIRPGPIQGNAVHPYLRRRQGLEPVTYMHPRLEPILAETRGVILYQEQILRIVMEIAGYTAGEADRFRRAMNRHRSRVEMETLRDEFVARCRTHGGLDVETAELIFRSAAGFAQFGFCKSHAAAFARTAYETAWLRLHHPAAWLCGLLNAQPMGFYHPSVLVDDAKRHGVGVLPVDVTRSRGRCTLEWVGDSPPPGLAVTGGMAPGWRLADGEVVRDAAERGSTPGETASRQAVEAACRAVGGAIAVDDRAALAALRRLPASPTLGGPRSPWAVRLGFNYVAGLGPAGRAACDEAARAGAVGSVAAFWQHTRLHRPAMENLVMVGGFDAVAPGRARRALLWELRQDEESLPPRRRRAAASAGPVAGTVLPGLDVPPGAPPPAAVASPPRGRGLVQSSPGAVVPVASPSLLEVPAPAPALPELTPRDRTVLEYSLSELSTGPHLVSHLRPALDGLGCIPLAAVRSRGNGVRVRVAGLVIARQAPASANGFRFFTLADEGGHLDLVFRPRVIQRLRAVVNFHPLLMVEGSLESEQGRVNVLVDRAWALDADGRPIHPGRAAPGAQAAAAPPTHQGHHPPATLDMPPSHDYR